MADVTTDTYANEAALPGSPTDGDMAYLIDNDRIYVYDGDASKWRYWNNDGEGGTDANDLAYTGAKTGNPTSGTNYVCSVQPDCHYDAVKYVEAADDGLAAGLGDAVDAWGDRSGNDNDAVQTSATYQPTYVKNHGNFGLQWPSSIGLGRIESPYDPVAEYTTPPGHTLVVVAIPPKIKSMTAVVENQGVTGHLSAGMKMPAYGISGHGPMICSVNTTAIYPSTKPYLAQQYAQVFTIYDYDDDQKIFTNLEEVFSGSVSYTQGNIDTRLGDVYWIGGASWVPGTYGSFGQTANNGHGGIIYEVLIFTTALSYTSDGSNLTDGNLKIVVDYLMNKYRISTNYINSAS